jgi:hypothetical protein
MKQIVKIVLAGLLSFGPVAAAAQSLTVNANTQFTIATGTPALNASGYRWLVDGVEIPGATDVSYTNTSGLAVNGSYTYVRQANVTGCGWQNSNAYLVMVIGGFTPPEHVPPPPGAESSATWPSSTITLSAPVRTVPINCTRLEDVNNSTKIENAYAVASNGRYLYTRPCVRANASALCPSPWRVPSDDDLNALYSLRETGPQSSETCTLTNVGLAVTPCYWMPNTVDWTRSCVGGLWSLTAETSGSGYGLAHLVSYTSAGGKMVGCGVTTLPNYSLFAVRCVR